MKKFFLAIFFLTGSLSAQSVSVHPTHEIYRFLKRLEAGGSISGYRDAVLPITRKEIASFLLHADSLSERLTQVDRSRLEFYKEEFFREIKMLIPENEFPEERWHLYTLRNDLTDITFDLVGGLTYRGRADGKFTQTRSNGIFMQGYLGERIGLYFVFRDNKESGSYFNLDKPMSPDQSHIYSRPGVDFMEYSFVEAQLNVDIAPWLRFSLEKMPNQWGMGNNGTLIFSGKAESFPQIKFRANLGKDVTFTYIHGFLQSRILDSVNSYINYDMNNRGQAFRPKYRSKYIASHIIEATVADGVDIALGESEVYGNRNPDPLYLIPIMFFKAAEHYSGDTDNTQFFGTFDITAIQNHSLYGTIFIDELSTDDFYRTETQRNQLGFTLGLHSFDLLCPATDLLVEYTRINPWVYNHKYPDATYQNQKIDMGHWIGQNADLLTVAGNYRPFHNLRIGARFESLRKGGKMNTDFQYQLPTPEFLYGPMMKTQSYGVEARYEPIRDLFVDANCFVSRYTQEAGIPAIFQYSRIADDFAGKIDFFVGVRYNFQ